MNLSRSTQTLDEELGVLLFDRDNRNAAVTSAGAGVATEAGVVQWYERTISPCAAIAIAARREVAADTVAIALHE